MRATTFQAFSDELTKIAVVGAMTRGFGSALKEGWRGSGNWMAGSGKITSKIPLGGKSLTLAGTAVQAPLALSKDDWSGQNRSRTERTMGLAGDAMGGLVGTGIGTRMATRASNAMKLTGRGRGALGLIGMTGGAIAGGLAGRRVLSAPSRFMRERKQDQLQRQAIGQQEIPPEQGAAV